MINNFSRSNFYNDVVQRTAGNLNFDKPEDINKWIAVWSMGSLGEYQEYLSAREHEHIYTDSDDVILEFGDFLWESTALANLCDRLRELSPEINTCSNDWESTGIDIDDKSIEYFLYLNIEQAKKILRDNHYWTDYHSVKRFARLCLHVDFLWVKILENYKQSYIELAAKAVDGKLRIRYPDGFDPDRSRDRSV